MYSFNGVLCTKAVSHDGLYKHIQLHVTGIVSYYSINYHRHPDIVMQFFLPLPSRSKFLKYGKTYKLIFMEI